MMHVTKFVPATKRRKKAAEKTQQMNNRKYGRNGEKLPFERHYGYTNLTEKWNRACVLLQSRTGVSAHSATLSSQVITKPFTSLGICLHHDESRQAIGIRSRQKNPATPLRQRKKEEGRL